MVKEEGGKQCHKLDYNFYAPKLLRNILKRRKSVSSWMFGEVQTEKETLSTNKSIRPITKRQMDIWINKRCNEKDRFCKRHYAI